MVEIIIDANADIDALLLELQRISSEILKLKTNSPSHRPLLWSDIYNDNIILKLFQERLSSVMSAAKSQRAIYFPRERLIIGNYNETEIEILAPHLRILPESAIHSKSKQEERTSAFKEAKVKALEKHREKMLGLAMQGLELPRGGDKKNNNNNNNENNNININNNNNNSEEEEEENPPPPPPPADDDIELESDENNNNNNNNNNSSSNDSEDEEEDEDIPPPPPPPDDDEIELESEEEEEEEDDDDDPPPPPPLPN